MAKNPAVKLKVKAPIEEKEPFTPGEFERVLQATYLYQDGRGQVNQENARELRTFVLVLRYSGLRISDAVLLGRTRRGMAANREVRIQKSEFRIRGHSGLALRNHRLASGRSAASPRPKREIVAALEETKV